MVRKGGKTRRIIGEVILHTRDEILQRDIAMETLVHRMLAKKGRRGRGSGDRPFAVPIEGGEVVGCRADSALADIPTLSGDIVV